MSERTPSGKLLSVTVHDQADADILDELPCEIMLHWMLTLMVDGWGNVARVQYNTGSESIAVHRDAEFESDSH